MIRGTMLYVVGPWWVQNEAHTAFFDRLCRAGIFLIVQIGNAWKAGERVWRIQGQKVTMIYIDEVEIAPTR